MLPQDKSTVSQFACGAEANALDVFGADNPPPPHPPNNQLTSGGLVVSPFDSKNRRAVWLSSCGPRVVDAGLEILAKLMSV